MADIKLNRGRMVYSIERNIKIIDESILSMWICISELMFKDKVRR